MEERLVLEGCCFTGHRPEKLGMSEADVKKLLKTEIKKAIDFGYCVFVSGMSRGVDLWAAELVLEEKKKNPYIRLVCAVPFDGFSKTWEMPDKEIYQEIIDNADYVKYISTRYFKSVFQVRNSWMVDHSSRVIAAYNGEKGGTKNTIDYAVKKGIEVINIME